MINYYKRFLLLVLSIIGLSTNSYANLWEGKVNGKSIIITYKGIIQDGKLRKTHVLGKRDLCVYGNTNFPNSPKYSYNYLYLNTTPSSWNSSWAKAFYYAKFSDWRENWKKICNREWKAFISKATIIPKNIEKTKKNSSPIKKKITTSDLSHLSNKIICKNVIEFSLSAKGFSYEGYKKSFNIYNREAKRRGLDCGVGGDKTVVASNVKTNLNEILKSFSDDRLCPTATIKTHMKEEYRWDYRSDYSTKAVNEAKRRGLDCGVKDDEVEKKKLALEKLKQEKQNKDRMAKILDEEFLGIGDSDKNICRQAVINGRWDTRPNFLLFVEEAKQRGLTCGIKSAIEEKKRIAEEKAKQEKERQAELEREQRLKAEQEKIKKKAAEAERKKKIEEEKRRKKKLAQEKARKKKLAEQERKRKLAQEKLKKQIANYKRKAKNFYKDIEEFVKAGAEIDLVQLSDFFDVKPNPENKWSSTDISRYEKLRQFMTSTPQFVSFEKERIGNRLKKSFAMKDQSIAELNKNLSELNGLMRKMFGSSEVPKIKSMIREIQSTLSNFNQSTANNILNKSSIYINSKLSKPNPSQNIKQVVLTSDTNWSKVKNDLTIQQQQFCQLTDRFYDNLNKARKSKNEIKVNMVHKERQENLDALIPQGNINNWIFKVIKIDQVEDGSAAVVLGLQCRSYVGSGQTIDIKKGMSKKDKKQWRATIPYNDRRFRELAKLDQGQFIVGSGTMLEINAYKPGQKETFYASQQIGEHPLTKGLNLEGELFITDLSYIAALN